MGYFISKYYFTVRYRQQAVKYNFKLSVYNVKKTITFAKWQGFTVVGFILKKKLVENDPNPRIQEQNIYMVHYYKALCTQCCNGTAKLFVKV